VAAGGEVVEVVQSPSKKRKVSTVAAGETEKGKGTAATQLSSSRTAPATPQGNSPSAWDPLLNPMEFIDKAVN
ncbi:hypothetical protein A2U01_0106105, partial [Trifolium medium]|nr:hypothetical protein [Trifolium medium]